MVLKSYNNVVLGGRRISFIYWWVGVVWVVSGGRIGVGTMGGPGAANEKIFFLRGLKLCGMCRNGVFMFKTFHHDV